VQTGWGDGRGLEVILIPVFGWVHPDWIDRLCAYRYLFHSHSRLGDDIGREMDYGTNIIKEAIHGTV